MQLIIKSLIIGASISLISAAAAFASTTGIITDENINVYAVANDENTVIGTFNSGKEITVINEQDSWLEIESEEFKNVYIPKTSVSLKKQKQ